MAVEYPKSYKYTKDHEWVEQKGAVVRVGITVFAQQQLGELVYVELPEVGKEVKKGETLCIVESTKAASDVYAPVSGKVLAVNSALGRDPSLIDKSAHLEGWICEIEITSSQELDEMVNADEYQKMI